MKKRAFTLLEVLSTIAIIMILFGISLPVYSSMQFSSDVDNAVKITVSTLRSAQAQAMAGLEDSQWGIRANGGVITLFRGDSYASRVAGYDLDYTLPGGVGVSGVGEVVFSKVTGNPSTTGTINFSKYDSSGQITINAKGIQTY
jgi:type II secretory pathway pseudopilin PulG